MGIGSQAIRLVVTCIAVAAGSAVSAGTCRQDEVTMRGDWGQARFSVEVARTPAERNKGLMNRESLPRSAGMLFVYERPRRVSFWMKDTLIPLDIIFMDASGTVGRIHKMATPMDTTPLFGGTDVQYVLEINGGLADMIGIGAGSELRHPAVDPDRAAWPC